MEFVDGITLANWLQTHGPMSLGELVQLVEQLAEAVDATHQCGIVHRDLKPSNVMVIEGKGPASLGKLIPKLLDFGIAKGTVASIAEDDHPTRVWDTAHDQLLAELPSHGISTPIAGSTCIS